MEAPPPILPPGRVPGTGQQKLPSTPPVLVPPLMKDFDEEIEMRPVPGPPSCSLPSEAPSEDKTIVSEASGVGACAHDEGDKGQPIARGVEQTRPSWMTRSQRPVNGEECPDVAPNGDAGAAPGHASKNDEAELLKQTFAVKEREYQRLLAELGRGSESPDGAQHFPGTLVLKEHGAQQHQQRRYSLPMMFSASDNSCNVAYRLSHLTTINCSGPVAAVALHGGVLAAATWNGELSLLDVDKWNDLGSLPGSDRGRLTSVTWPTASPSMLGVGRGSNIEMWELGVAAEQISLRTSFANGKSGCQVESLDSHQSQKLICSAAADGIARVWDCTSGKVIRELSSLSGASLSHCHFVGKGQTHYQYLICTSNLEGQVSIWDVRGPKHVSHFVGPSDALCVASHGEKHFLSAGFGCGSVVSRELRTWRPLTELKLQAINTYFDNPSARSVSFSGNGKFLAVGDGDGRVTVFDLFRQCTSVSIHHQSDAILSLLWGDRLAWAHTSAWYASASADGTVELWAQLGRPPEFET